MDGTAMGEGAKPRKEAAVATFARAGFARVEPAILQPMEPFLDLSGEDIRRRMFVTQDGSGQEWCLRPEYTIPVARDHIAAGARAGAYCYAGPVFRIRSGEPSEFAQAGLESFGRTDTTAADAEIMALTLEAVAAQGFAEPVIRMGDGALLVGFLDALDVPAAARRRLLRAIAQGSGDPLAQIDAPSAPVSESHSGLIAALQGQDPHAAKAFVEDVLSIAGISSVGGRSAGDIAERFLAKAAEKDQCMNDQARRVLGQIFAVKGDPDEALAALRGLSVAAGLDVGQALDRFDERIGFLAARGVDVSRISFSARFARNLDYYTGFVFELTDPDRTDGKPVAGGGRYDGLMQRLGAAEPVPAVGASIWLGRLADAVERSAEAASANATNEAMRAQS
ncbi:MAG: ATP phosphoribosyltransferase regulatory subunit [Bosea sp. (in: a-proteobacteria)]